MSFQDLVDDFSWPKVPVFKWPLTISFELTFEKSLWFFRNILLLSVYMTHISHPGVKTTFNFMMAKNGN